MFEFERETKNTARFQEVPAKGEPKLIGTLYVQKWAFNGTIPAKLQLEITEA